ncbi:hypothetical protein ACSSNL_18135 [Thalassobius sp. S69A]|uniref:hypothetical protein n=1 Tax=unclassified Thalassovita TaxID=2619711 RepID=UPI003C7AD1C8
MSGIGRRMALKALMGSPMVAGAAAKVAAKEVLDAGNFADLESDAPQDPVADSEFKPSPVRDLFWRTVDGEDGYVRKNAIQDMPESVRSKKSWSPVFKEHVATLEALERHRASQSELGMLKWLVKRGVLPGEVLD